MDQIFRLMISVTIVLAGIMLMVLGWSRDPRGGWPCVVGLMIICAGAALAGFTKEDKKK